MPFLLRRLIGNCYHLGPEGAVIGSDPSCSIVVPSETGVLPMHCGFHWEQHPQNMQSFDEDSQQRESVKQTCVGGKGHFVLKDLTEGRGILHVISNMPISAHAFAEEMQTDSDQEDTSSSGAANETWEPASTVLSRSLYRGLKFVTGRIEWTLSALPAAEELLAKAFNVASQQDLPALRHLFESTIQPYPPALTVTGEDVMVGMCLFVYSCYALFVISRNGRGCAV